MFKPSITLFLLLTILLQGCQCNKHSTGLSKKRLQKVTSSKQIDNYFNLVNQNNRHELKYSNVINDYPVSSNKMPDKDLLDKVVVTGSKISAADLITNNQVVGVDEGDIIKRYQNMLIVLRKGKLYSLDISETYPQKITKIDEVDAFSPYWKHKAWFDEILIDKGMVLVLGFNYDMDSAEIIRFNLTNDGKFSYKDNYLIMSEDYFDEESYASRLFNHQYTTYIPIELDTESGIKGQLPKIVKVEDDFNGDEDDLIWNSLIEISDIYYPIQTVLNPMLHSFIVCPLDEDVLICNGVGIISSWDNLYYNNGENIYMWTSAWKEEALKYKQIKTEETLYDYKTSYRNENQYNYKTRYRYEINNKDVDELYNPLVYRISLDTFDVVAIQVKVMPTSQFAFHHQDNALYLFGLLDKKKAQLVKMPDSQFDKSASMSSILVREINNGAEITSTQRYVGNYFLIGDDGYDFVEDKIIKPLTAIHFKNGNKKTISLSNYAKRIEAINNKALVIGKTLDNNLGVSLFSPDNPNEIQQTTLLDRLEGESRSHAFNYTYLDNYFLAGITTQNKDKAENEDGYYYWDDNTSSDITFIGGNKNVDYIGELKSQVTPSKKCKVSCEDWYGNSRPFFIGKRIFALSGDELIEAELVNGEIIEKDRININE